MWCSLKLPRCPLIKPGRPGLGSRDSAAEWRCHGDLELQVAAVAADLLTLTARSLPDLESQEAFKKLLSWTSRTSMAPSAVGCFISSDGCVGTQRGELFHFQEIVDQRTGWGWGGAVGGGGTGTPVHGYPLTGRKKRKVWEVCFGNCTPETFLSAVWIFLSLSVKRKAKESERVLTSLGS